MKTSNGLKIAVIVLLVVGVFTLPAFSSEPRLRIYTQAGGMSVTEQKISEGHKSYLTFGIENPLNYNFTMTLEGFIRGEPADEDPEIPKWGFAGQLKYSTDWNWKKCHPYIGIRYDQINRGMAPKYQGENPEYRQQTVHKFSSGLGGVHFENDLFYVNLGTVIPLIAVGNFGPDLGVGIKGKHWDLGFKYKEIRLKNYWFESGENDFSFYFAGFELGYSF